MIRRCRPDDHEWIRTTAVDVYRELGDYRTIIPSWLGHPGVLAYVDVDEQETRRGFILVGFYAPPDLDPTATSDVEACVADLLAIAVAPAFQRRGLGRGLLEHALRVAQAARAQRIVLEIRLTVAADNDGARALFRAAGFELLDGDYGTYGGGQQALRLHRPL
jgi:ribosomal protein S18 acetylase RimI-like enzyme